MVGLAPEGEGIGAKAPVESEADRGGSRAGRIGGSMADSEVRGR